MTIVADKALLRAQFLAQFDTDAVQTIYDNAPETSIDVTRPYVRFGINAEEALRETFGTSGNHQNYGRVWLQVLVPHGQGTKVADQIVDQFITVFRNWRSASDDISCGTELMRVIPNSDHYQVNVSIPYLSNRT